MVRHMRVLSKRGTKRSCEGNEGQEGLLKGNTHESDNKERDKVDMG